jgi:hypothetical protein
VFSSPGSYRLRVAAFDEGCVKANPDRYYTIRQDVWAQVLEKDAPLNVILTTDSSFLGDTLLIQLTSERPIEGLETDDFQCARCEPLTILKTSENTFAVLFRALTKGPLSVQLKESAVVDAKGQHNGASNLVELGYSPP